MMTSPTEPAAPDLQGTFAMPPVASVSVPASAVPLAVSAPVTVVYTDGSCIGNPGPGGWAWAVDGGRSDSGGDPATTNQRMEVRAVVEALRVLDGPVEVVSDSTYVVNCFRQRWWDGWYRRGWRNTQGKPVANRDLWEPLLTLALEGGRPVSFRWVKGHSGDRMNDVVDQLALAAASAAAAGRRGVGAAADGARDAGAGAGSAGLGS
jgi:ribonuclease HI